MSTTLYKEAIAEAQQLKELAEQNAKNKIIEALTPRIQAMIESRLLSEQEDIEIEDVDDSEDEMSNVVIGSDLLLPPEEEEEPEDEEDEEGSGLEEESEAEAAKVVINAQGDVNVNVSENFKKNLNAIKKTIDGSPKKPTSALLEKAANLRNELKKLEKITKNVDLDSLSASQRDVLSALHKKMLDEALFLHNKAIVNSEYDSQDITLQTLKTLKEMNNMTRKRNRAIFNRLFEAAEAGGKNLDELDLVFDDEDLEALGIEDAEGLDLGDLDIDIMMSGEEEGEEEPEEGEEEEGDEEDEGEEEEELSLEADMPYGKPRREAQMMGKKQVEEVFEVDPRMLRNEIRRLKSIREQAEAEADQFGDAEVVGDVFFEVDEDSLINVLADELGRIKSVGKAAPANESRRRAARSSQQDTLVKKLKLENQKLQKQMSDINLFNAKLLYVNKLMQNRNVNSKQQRAMVEALDNAKTVREAKLVYESLTRSLNEKSLNEGTRRILGSSSKPTRSGSTTATNEAVQTDRWAQLAGIKNNK